MQLFATVLYTASSIRYWTISINLQPETVIDLSVACIKFESNINISDDNEPEMSEKIVN
ncbi:3030_t:CDS:1, partial [Racocetra persica]